MELKDVLADTNGELFDWSGSDGRPILRVSCAQRGEDMQLMASLQTTARSEPLELSVPMLARSTSTHALVLRYSGHRVELWVDGVLVDEEWPMGALPAMRRTVRFGSVDRAAIWSRSLTDDEVLQISGGRDGLAEREERMLGTELPVGQYWSPRGFNTHVGDCMPFFHAGRFHLFYLADRRNHGSKWGLGAHQWGHCSTTDLVRWEQHPLAIAITNEGEGSICTGSVFFHDGVYHAFYAVRMADGSASPLCVATSNDGIHFAKQPALTHLRAPYLAQPARDPMVFLEEASGLYHMLVTTSLLAPPAGGPSGCLAHLVSRDLLLWEQREPLLLTESSSEPECPDYFFWRGWYYLVFSQQGIAHYQMSRHALGPWQKPSPDTFDGPAAMVMKTAAFTGDRRIGAAFVPSARNRYAGKVIFREVIQNPDGTLRTAWPAELGS